eukprot:10090626-Karenia_brevis.AAC.1
MFSQRQNGGKGNHAVLRQYFCLDKKFINADGKKWILGTWVKAVQEGRTFPRSEKAVQML